MTPESWIGKSIGVMCPVCGLLMLALPLSVVAKKFSIHYRYANVCISLPPKRQVGIATEANTFLQQNAASDAQNKFSEQGK